MVSGGNTQTVCLPFQLQAAAADADGALTNLTILLNGTPIAGAGASPVVTTLGLDFPGLYTFTAVAQDGRGGTTWATEEVAVVSCPLHWLVAGGFRTNGAFKLCMLGETGRDYQLLASTNLNTTNWTPIGIMESTNGIWRLLDGGASTNHWRFYRAERVP